MKILERAIRLGLESDSINTVYTYTQNESVEMVANGTNAETEMVRYRASVESKISRSTSQESDGLSYNDRSFSEEENTYDICTQQKKLDNLNPKQVYWFKDEMDKW